MIFRSKKKIEDTQQGSEQRSETSPKDLAYCETCDDMVPVLDSASMKTNSGIAYQEAHCAKCGGPTYKLMLMDE